LLTSRDNQRQAAVDIVQLTTSLPALDLDGDTVADIDGTRIHFSGLSLGGIVGTVANAQPIATVSAYLSVPGGGVANLLRESAALSPRINAGLQAAGLVQGSTLYEQFFRDAQAVVDSGDPINYVAAAIDARPVLLTQVVNDTVVPNSATQRLVNAATWVKASAAGPTPVAAGTGTWVHFLSGSHGSLLDPTASLAVTTEMQTHAASLVASGGAAFVVANPVLLEP
ncbi:MAG: lipase, partial [Steroidobacteraceae bacterium]